VNWSRIARIVPNGLRSRTRDTFFLLRDYLLQETVDPLRLLGRYVVWGTLGSFFVGIGALMLLIALLRMLQEEFPVLNGSLSWIPYLVVVLVGAAVAGLTVLRIVTGPARRRRPVEPKEAT
jgi:hypothetical protein